MVTSFTLILFPGFSTDLNSALQMFGISKEHLGNILKEKIFKKVFDGKVVFVLKVCDLIITNIDPVITK